MWTTPLSFVFEFNFFAKVKHYQVNFFWLSFFEQAFQFLQRTFLDRTGFGVDFQAPGCNRIEPPVYPLVQKGGNQCHKHKQKLKKGQQYAVLPPLVLVFSMFQQQPTQWKYKGWRIEKAEPGFGDKRPVYKHVAGYGGQEHRYYVRQVPVFDRPYPACDCQHHSQYVDYDSSPLSLYLGIKK
jgi:hypothetical protein